MVLTLSSPVESDNSTHVTVQEPCSVKPGHKTLIKVLVNEPHKFIVTEEFEYNGKEVVIEAHWTLSHVGWYGWAKIQSSSGKFENVGARFENGCNCSPSYDDDEVQVQYNYGVEHQTWTKKTVLAHLKWLALEKLEPELMTYEINTLHKKMFEGCS